MKLKAQEQTVFRIINARFTRVLYNITSSCKIRL